MATYYIDYNGGNDANDGLSFANRRKTLPEEISRANTNQFNAICGNEYRIMGMPATNMGINATWVVGQPNRYDESGGGPYNEIHITGATAASPIEITVNADHNYSTGDLVYIRNVYGVLQANGTWVITVTGARTFTLNGSSGTGTYTGGSSADYVMRIPGKGIKVNTGIKHIFKWACYNNNTNVQSGSSAYMRSDGTSPLGVASSNVTLRIRGGYSISGNLPVHNIQIGASFTTGKAWYYKLDSTLDLSSHQQISMWYNTRASDTNNNTSHIRFCLCTDETGDTIAHSVEIPGFARKGIFPVVKDFGTNLNSAIKSIALYVDSDVGEEDIRLMNVIACPASSNASTLTHQHIWSKNTTAEPWWYQAQFISDDHLIFGGPIGVDFDYESDHTGTSIYHCIYAHTSETVPLYKIQPYYTYKNNVDLDITESNKFRFYVRYRDTVGITTAGIPEPSPQTKITGGWNNTDMSTQDSITWHYLGDRSNQYFGTGDENMSNLLFSHWGIMGCSTTALMQIRGYRATIGTLYLGNQSSGYISLTSARDQFTTVDKLYVAQNAFGGLGSNGSMRDILYEGGPHIKDIRFSACGNHTFGNVNYNAEGMIIDHMEVYGTRYIMQNQYRNGHRTHLKIKNLIAKNIETLLASNTVPLKVYNSTMTNIQQERYEWANTHRGHGTSMTTFENYNGVSGDHRIFFDYGSIKTESSVRHGTTGIAWAFRPTMVFGGTYSRGQLTANTEILPLYLTIAEFYAVANKAVTCKAYMRRTNTGLTMNLKASFKNSFPHLSQDYIANCTANVDTWQEVTLTFTPISSGTIYINAEVYGGDSYTGYVDSVSLTQAP